METTISDSQLESQRPILKSYVDSVEIVKLQKFVVALYDRIEQLELENDSIRNELSSLAARLASQSIGTSVSDASFSAPKSKAKKSRMKKEEGEQPLLSAQKIVDEPTTSKGKFQALKSAASSLLPDAPESIDTNAALEIVSWSILNGSNLAAPIKFLSENISM